MPARAERSSGAAGFHSQFIVEKTAAEGGDDEEDFVCVGGGEVFEEACGVDGTRGAGDGDDDAFIPGHFCHPASQHVCDEGEADAHSGDGEDGGPEPLVVDRFDVAHDQQDDRQRGFDPGGEG